MSTFTAFFDATFETHWDDTADLFDAATTYGRIRVVEEETGEDVAAVRHTEVLDWRPDVYDRLLAEAGWQRTGEWRFGMLCTVEPAAARV